MRTLFVCAVMLLSFISPAQQVAKGLTASNNVFIGFYEYKPIDYNSNNNKYPLIIFLHGIGERGNGTTELSKVASNAIPRYINAGHPMKFTWNGKTETFLVLSPQLSNNYGYWQNFYIDEMIKYAKQNLRVDTNRIILTGLSLGGGGVWYYAGGSVNNAKQLSAIGVSCGTCQGIDWCNIAKANLPTWAFHAQDDGTVGVGCTTGAINSINACNPAVKPYMTIWPSGQHWIWDRVFDTAYAYQNPNIFEWFLGQNKSLPVNKRPVADAGADVTVSLAAASTTLNGNASTDSDGNIVRYVWRLISGPGTPTLATAVSTNGVTSITGLSTAGTYKFELKAIDNRADWSLDTLTVTVAATGSGSAANLPPVPNAGADVALTLPTNSTVLNGSASYDREGYINAYQWTKISGPDQYTFSNAAAANNTVTNLTQGTYSFRLTVWDNQWLPNNDTVIVSVLSTSSVPPPAPANQLPTARAGADVTITLPVSSVSLNGSTSSDPDGTIASYSWSKISGPTDYTLTSSNTAVTTAGNLAQGTYTFRLQVTDNANGIASDTVVIVVKPAPVTTLIANAGADQTIQLPSAATLNGASSNDPGGSIKSWQWSKISGPTCAIADDRALTTTLSGLAAGTYVFRLVVWDHNWMPWADTMQVTVKGIAGSQAPVAIAGTATTVTLPANNTTLNGTASYDPAGTISTYQWTKVNGPAPCTITNTTASVTTVSNLAAGKYTFRLDVTNDKNLVSSDTVQVIVNTEVTRIPNAGADVALTLPLNSTTLNGSASLDPGGDIKAYQWIKVSGPAQYTVANDRAVTTPLSNLITGTYVFRLVTWDHNWVPWADTMQITVTAAMAATSVTARTTNVTTAAVTVTAENTGAIKAYPNPATQSITLECPAGKSNTATAIIYNASGTAVDTENLTASGTGFRKNIAVANLAPGVYHIAVVTEQNQRITTSFIKK